MSNSLFKGAVQKADSKAAHSRDCRVLWAGIILYALLAGVLVAPAWAEQVDRDRVILTATRTEELMERVPANVFLITRQEIDLSVATTILELLEYVPGIVLRDEYGNAASGVVDFGGFSRGLSTAVLVDGRKVNRPGVQAVDWNLIPLDNVERIEILKGGSAGVLYGDGAVVAVVNIITRGAVMGDGVWSLNGRMGGFGEQAGSVSVGGADERMLYYLFGRMGEFGGFRENGGLDASDFNIRITDNFVENYYFGFEYTYHDDDQGVPGPLTYQELAQDRAQAAWPSAASNYELSSYGFTLGQTMSDAMIMEVQYYVDELDSELNNSGDTVTDKLETTKTLVKLVYGGQQHALTAGLDIIQHEGDSVYGIDSEGLDSNLIQTRKETGYYINDSFSLSDQWVVSAGYRQEEAEYDLSLTGSASTVPLSEDYTHAVEGDAYYAGTSYAYALASKFYLNYTNAYSFPASEELLDPYTGSRLDLEPQTSRSMEGGFVHTMSKNTSIRASLFRTDVENEILIGGVGPTQESTQRDGLELGFTYGLMEGMALSVDYTRVEAGITSGPYEGRDLPLVPEQAASASLATRFSAFTVVFQGRWSDNRRVYGDLGNDLPELSEYMTLSGKLSYGFEGGAFYLGVSNMLDEEYETYGGARESVLEYYPASGRRWYAGIRMNI